MTDNAHAADIVAVMGATGAGKSSAICAKLAADNGPRRLVWDPGEDYGAFGDVLTTRRVIYERVTKAGAFRLVYRPPFDLERARLEFDWFCRVAYAVGDVLVVADELEDVMGASWAPAGWRLLVRKGRKRGVRIIAASQVPAGIEKRFWDQATVIRSGRLNGRDSAKTMGDALMVDPAALIALPPLHWLQRSIYEPAIAWGRIEWRDGRPVDVLLGKKPLPGAPAP